MVEWSDYYGLFFGLGAIITAIHAYSLYSEPAPGGRSSVPVQMASADLIALCGPKAYFRGFLWYLAFTEAAYLVLATSGTVLTLASAVSGVPERGAGAMSAAAGIAPPNLLLPIAAASFLSTVPRLKLFSELEALLRRASHYLAGIPGTIYLISEAVEDFDLDAMPGDGGKSTVQRDAARLAESVSGAIQGKGLANATVDGLAKSIERVHVYWNWIAGIQGRQFWPPRSRDALRPQLSILGSQYQRFDSELTARLSEVS